MTATLSSNICEGRSKKSVIQSIIASTPFQAVPDCKSMQLDPVITDRRLEPLGIYRQYPRKVSIRPVGNEDKNRYMARQIKRLRNWKGDPKKFFRVVRHLMANSTSFMTAGFNHVNPRWYKEKSIIKVRQLIASHKANVHKTNVRAKRAYLEKANGKLRKIYNPSRE